MGKRIVIDLAERFKNAFGFVTKNQSSNLGETGFTDKTGVAEADVYVQKNISFEDITLSGNGYDLRFGFKGFSNKDGLGDLFAPPPMVSFRKSKNITRTEIDGSDAEVVERYGDRSWEISIQGILIDLINHEYPGQQVRTLRRLFDTPKPFEISSQIFDDIGVKSIYFEDAEFAGVQGFQDTIQFTLKARSIKPVEFFLKQ